MWTTDWNFTHDVILYAAGISKDRANAMSYLNKVLSNWNSAGIKTLDKAKEQKVEAEQEQNFIKNNYTSEQIASLISNLDEVEV